MAVFIDIPGIGNIEAKNAASEATLREILKAMKGRGAGGAAGGAGGGSGAANPLASMNKSAGSVTKVLGKFGGAVGIAAGVMVKLSESTIGVIKALADIGDSVENAANVFSGIPIVGKMFSAVASASQKVNDSYLAAASGGASFAGSMNQFVATASAAGMTMEKFGQFVSQNGQGMLGLGSTVEEGAKRFGQVSKALRSTSSDLYALGFSTQEINQGLANYSRNLRLSGRQGSQSNAELVAGSKKYLREMDLLAKITGESRADKEKEREQLMLDGQFRAAMAGLGPDVEASVATMIQSLPSKELQNLAKDVVATGSVTRSGNQALAAQFPGLVSQLQSMHKQTQSNVAVSRNQNRQMLMTTKSDSQASMARNKSALAASEELADVAAGVASGARINIDAFDKAGAEQNKAAKSTDGMNKTMQEAQAELAKISNEFTMYLANSGILPIMLDAFKALVGFVRNYVVPAFNFLATGITVVWNFLSNNLTPAFTILSQYIKEVGRTILSFGKFVWDATAPLRALASLIWTKVWPVFTYVADFLSDVFRKVGDVVQDFLTPIFDTLGRIINSVTNFLQNNFEETLKDVANFMDTTFIQPFVKVANYIGEKVAPMFDPVIQKFTDIKNGIVEWLAKWNTFSDIAESLKLRFQSMQISLQKLILWVDETTDLWKTDEEKAEYKKRAEEIAQREQDNIKAREALEQRLSNQATANLAAARARQEQIDLDRKKRDEKIAYERSIRDRKIADWQLNSNRTVYDGARAATGAMAELSTQTASNYEDSVALAGVEYARTNQPATAGAEATRAAIVNQSAAQQPQPQSGTPAEQDPRGRGTGRTTNPPTTQESAETLLAQLNSKMDQLIKINKDVHSVNERQLTVQQSMTGDLYVSV